MVTVMHKEVLDFLSRFTNNGQFQQVENAFTNGCCYWMAYILAERFRADDAVIMYDEVMNHFGTMVDGVVYDITGDVTGFYDWHPWSELEDDALRFRITRDCINF